MSWRQCKHHFISRNNCYLKKNFEEKSIDYNIMFEKAIERYESDCLLSSTRSHLFLGHLF